MNEIMKKKKMLLQIPGHILYLWLK